MGGRLRVIKKKENVRIHWVTLSLEELMNCFEQLIIIIFMRHIILISIRKPKYTLEVLDFIFENFINQFNDNEFEI